MCMCVYTYIYIYIYTYIYTLISLKGNRVQVVDPGTCSACAGRMSATPKLHMRSRWFDAAAPVSLAQTLFRVSLSKITESA